jgi:CheY-like chemotaxis protein
MVVDDDRGFGEFVRKVAQSCGFDVFVAEDAAAFQTRYLEAPPDLILLDLQMPGTDGVELLRTLAQLRCAAPVLVMSGLDAKVVDIARRLGVARGLKMDRVLSKPIRAADLRAVLDEFKLSYDAHVG